MFKRFATTLSAAAIALSGMVAAPAPARAETDEFVKFLLGAAAIGLIASQANRNRATERAAPPPVRHVPPARHDDWRRDDWRRDLVVPASCLFDVQGRYGPRPVIGARCVERWDRRADLPEACVFDIRPGQGERRVYGLHCLRDRGYRVVRG